MPLRGPVSVKLYKKEDAEILRIGPMTCFVFEDGSNTDNRVGAITFIIPPGVSGPPMHWHRFHDECFLVTKGTVRFTIPEGSIDASEGNLMVVPPRAVHTFANASETEEAEVFMTATPGYCIDYFRMLAQGTEDGKKLATEDTEYLMALFGTFPPDVNSEP